MTRFLIGLAAGAVTGGVTWGATGSPHWTVAVTGAVVLVVWFGPDALDDWF